tara:strand:+ start:97 stop:663 length:567 start_codon:yes stop_codon:yes gene_type:complete
MPIGLWGERLKKYIKKVKQTRKKRRKKKNKNTGKGKGNKIKPKKTSNKCPPKEKKKISWLVQNSMRHINAFNNAKKPGETANFNKVVGVMTTTNLSGELVDGYWIVQWNIKRSSSKYGHYFLAFQDEFPQKKFIKIKDKNPKNIYIDSEGGYKKKRKTKRRTKKSGGGNDFFTWLFPTRNKTRRRRRK